MKVWIVGQLRWKEHRWTWEFQGVFSTEEKAVSQCKTYLYGVYPAQLDEELSDEYEGCPGVYFPNTGHD